ncbi:MogA/MoaB family molybdenum cofactor biosynthesis protein [Thermofilum pendens]|uniref:Molybdenum cofactor synthesis domain n=1 Tax=Thermofilum pendens (strain DSM 2475 / Hrk 5) TaxID=368408 RepID=A1RWZ1_THEPD|nr:MogA/MoaB family molybdenum cofactor biosynthesis protein [Thermofilum pendens]ABL77721.1 molybdenum cofactor synthesis domain [Thermofilum pendens Hrk 5]
MDKDLGSSIAEHKRKALRDLRYAFVTVSTSRFDAELRGERIPDVSVEVARELIERHGDKLVSYILVPDNPRLILEALVNLLERNDVDVVVFSGGTGPAPSDVTVETVEPLLEKRLAGFGDVFRGLSYQEVGSSAFLSNAIAGVVHGKLVFLLPGSPDAVREAFEKLILPESGHVLSIARGHR